jgi:hypothetical protein
MMFQARFFMVDNEKFQNARGWASLVGIVILIAVAAWKYLVR